MLKLVVFSLIEVCEVLLGDMGVCAVLNCFQDLLVHIVSHKLKGLRIWDSRYFLDQLVSVLALLLRLI